MEAPDGREAWVTFSPEQKLAFICTDIHGQGMPHNAAGFTSEFLRQIADKLDQMTEENSDG